MRIIDGDLSRCIYFVAVDADDMKTRETGLSGFTVAYSVDGGDDVAMTTPTTTEIDATNAPGLYALDIDESGMVAVPDGAMECECAVHVTKTGMAPVTRVYEIYRGYKIGKAVTGTLTATSFSTDLTEATADWWKDAYCMFLMGNLKGQVKKVTSYTVSSGLLNFTSGFTGAPANNDKFVLINR